VWESHVTWGTPVQSFVFLGLLVFELEPMYATSDRQTDADDRLMPPPCPTGRGHNNILIICTFLFFHNFRGMWLKISALHKFYHEVKLTSKASSWRRGPTPDNMSRCGEPIAPAEMMTSFLARTWVSVLLRKNSMPYAPPLLIRICTDTCTLPFHASFRVWDVEVWGPLALCSNP